VTEKHDLLLEIGCEEIPAGYVAPALKRMEELFAEFCEKNRISRGAAKTFGTPRRLALTAEAVADRQDDMIIEIKGPPSKAALAPDGSFNEAAAKFAESRGGSLKQLQIRPTDRGDYLFMVKKEKGGKTAAALAELPKFIFERLAFPKSMRWDVRPARFARPARWILLLYGNKPVRAGFNGLPCGPFTYGNRWHGSKKIKVSSIPDYFEKLEAAGVVADHRRRREMIRQAATGLARGNPYMPDELLDEVNFLVEYPYAAIGTFPVEFTELPPEVLIICIKKNQRYFPVSDPATGRMLPEFVVAMNAPLTESKKVIEGYERVLNSRLKDAKFFYDEDLKTSMKNRAESLKRITFQDKLGSLWDKQERVKGLAADLGAGWGAAAEDVRTAVEAASLMKADLASQMVFEYTEIQGTVGKYYILAEGGRTEVAQAVEEHYMPRFADDALAASAAGALLAVADKMDTVTGYFSVGLIPTGSADPYQLRRAALGVIRTLEAFNMPFTFEDLARMSAGRHGEIAADENSRRKLVDFFEERYRNYMVASGYPHDVMEALAARKAPLAKKREAADAIVEVKDTEEFRDFREVFTRISNIMSKSKPSVGKGVNPDLFQAEEERGLREAWLKAKPALEDPNETESGKLRAMFALAAPGAAFFDKVLVMDKDENVRENRGVMLFEILTGITENSADYKLIVKK